jgi:hypothetical protein
MASTSQNSNSVLAGERSQFLVATKTGERVRIDATSLALHCSANKVTADFRSIPSAARSYKAGLVDESVHSTRDTRIEGHGW